MGRKRTRFHDLPPGMHIKGRWFYLVTSVAGKRKWIKLATLDEKALAYRKWAELASGEQSAHQCTFQQAATRYRREVFPTKKPRTQKDNEAELDKLLAVFGEVTLDDIKPADVRRYLDVRGETAPVRANREKALLSHIFNKAREWGYTDAPNPCAGISGFRETGRDRYIEDAEFLLIWRHADPILQDAMDLAYRTGQRPSDVLRMERGDIRDGKLWIRQGKTGKALRIEVSGELEAIIQRAIGRPRKAIGRTLVQDEKGQPLTYWQLAGRFTRARDAAVKALRAEGRNEEADALLTAQFRDIRAKTSTDTGNLAWSQSLLGHQNRAMTEHYTRARAGDVVQPLDRKL